MVELLQTFVVMTTKVRTIPCPECGDVVKTRGLNGHMKLKHPGVALKIVEYRASTRVALETSRDALKTMHKALETVGGNSKQDIKCDDGSCHVKLSDGERIEIEIFIPENQIEWFHQYFPDHFSKEGYWCKKHRFSQSECGKYFFQVKEAGPETKGKRINFYAARRI